MTTRSKSPKSKPTRPAIAALCPVAQIGRQQQLLWQAKQGNDKKFLHAEDAAKITLRRQYNELDDLIDANERRASHELATSLEGALFHVILVSSQCDRLRNGVFAEEYEAESTWRQIDRMLYSIRRVLEDQADALAEDFTAEFYMPHEFDPHSCVRDAELAGDGAS